jgi:hypothetical protein
VAGRRFVGQAAGRTYLVGYDFLYWLKRASGAACPSALRSAGPRAAGGRFAPVLAHPARYALRTRRTGASAFGETGTPASFSTAIARSRRATPLTSEPPTRRTRICTPALGIKGAARRCAMACGHPGPRTPPSMRAGYRIGGSPLALAEARTPCAPPTTSARHFVHRSHKGRRARTGPPSLRNEKVRGSNPLSSTRRAPSPTCGNGAFLVIFIRMGFRPVNDPIIGPPEKRPDATSESAPVLPSAQEN